MDTPQKIIKEVAKKFEIYPQDIVGTNRNEWFIRARREAVKRLRDELKLSFPTIAKIFNKKDHTSSIHLYKTKGREA